METRRIRTLEELGDIAREVLTDTAPSEGRRIFALSGDLGSGKTAFVKKFAEELGVAEEVTSPTFVIMKSYEIPGHPRFKTLTHIDAYRVESEDEMRVLGWEELCADQARLIAVEWPERIAGIMPSDARAISFTLQGEERIITF